MLQHRKTTIQGLYLTPVLLCCLILIRCGSARPENVVFEKNPPFTIAEAQFQRWTTGKDAQESGWNLYVIFEKIESTVTLQDIFFKDLHSEIKNTTKFPKRYTATLTDKKIDLVMHSDPLKEAANEPPQKSKFQLEENNAVISFLFKGKKRFYKIADLSKKNAISYPH